jgi:2-polyprenyl-6-methoxyphenol hydroxylase-like FAD-dependent oxidoreductase
VRVEQGGRARDLRADLVVACDGRGSPVRHMAGLELRPLPERYDVLWCKLAAPAAFRGRCPIFVMVAAGTNPAICYPSPDGRLQYGLVVRKGAAIRPTGDDWVEELVQSAPAWLAEHVRAQRATIAGPQRLSVLAGRAPAWAAPGLLLLGDAAHPMSPVRAQGVNLALRDAIVAANHLVPALRSGDPAAVDAAARAVQAEREPEIVRAQALQRREAAGEVEARGATRLYALARFLAPRLGRYRWAQRAWLRRQRELRHGVTAVWLRVA